MHVATLGKTNACPSAQKNEHFLKLQKNQAKIKRATTLTYTRPDLIFLSKLYAQRIRWSLDGRVWHHINTMPKNFVRLAIAFPAFQTQKRKGIRINNAFSFASRCSSLSLLLIPVSYSHCIFHDGIFSLVI